MLLEECQKNQWDRALHLCRFSKQALLWNILAGRCLQKKEFETAEVALANIECIEKV